MSKKNIKPVEKKKPQTTAPNTIWIRIIISLLVLFLYGKTASYDFTLDDDVFYLKHASVQKGIGGIGEIFRYGSMEKFNNTKGVQPYRPVTLISFAIEKQFFDNNPAKSHIINVLLYIILLQVLFSVLLILFPDVHSYISGIMVLLFALHPVHTEVVASVKSRDELLACLFGFCSWLYLLKATTKPDKKIKNSILGFIFFALALLSKESAIAFLAIIPLAWYMFSSFDLKKTFISALPLAAISAGFLFVRFLIVGSQSAHRGIDVLDNVLYATQNFAQLTATKMEILFYYVKLLFVPWPLSWDYSFNQTPILDWSSFLPWLSTILYVGMGLFAIRMFKKQKFLSFAVLFFLIACAPVNNFFFVFGATFAERFLFVPSLAFILALVVLLCKVTDVSMQTFAGKSKTAFLSVIAILSVCYFIASSSRTSDWKNNFTIFKSGVQAAPNSSKTNQAMGTIYGTLAFQETNPERQAIYQDSAKYFLEKSLSILPANADAAFKLAQLYEMKGNSDSAIKYYRNTIQYKPEYYMANDNLGALYAAKQNYDSALSCFNRAYQSDSTIEMTLANLVVVHFNKGQYDSVIKYGDKALTLNIQNDKINTLLPQAKALKK